MIETSPLPDNAMLRVYSKRGYTDCFVTDIDGTIGLDEFIRAFYTSFVFRIERFILTYLASRPSSDGDVVRLADGSASEFAAWNVEQRAENQLLLSDFRGHTRSWLMTEAHLNGATESTRLYFGSAVLAKHVDQNGNLVMGPGYRALLGFHRFYSRVLLHASRSRLKSRKRSAGPGVEGNGG